LNAIRNPVIIKTKTTGNDLLLNIKRKNFDDMLKSKSFFSVKKINKKGLAKKNVKKVVEN
jgi:hypothetical protein